MKGKRVRIGCAAASILMGISGTYAYYRSSVETINKIAVGDVNIGIWEYEEDGDGEKKYEGPENGIVLPSQVISKIPRITNYAEPCYVRVSSVLPHLQESLSRSDPVLPLFPPETPQV